MRNLKRVLSLTLASVMLLGMMVIGSSAAEAKKIDFTDADEIEYTEAVDVMVALGILEGNPNGNFNPKGTLTREAAAKIICYMLLGEENAEKLTANKDVFKDVAANRWSAGYISYCVERSILAGNGNGSFNPTGELTGVAFGKMLLVALGYDPAIQGYTGPNWALSVAADMVDAGIAPAGVLLNAPMTREQAAQTAFQTLTADVVSYASKGTTVNTTDGTSVIVGASKAEADYNASSKDYREVSGDRDDKMQFCEKYFDKLKMNDSDTDAFNRQATKWSYDKKEICKNVKEADASYTKAVKAKDIYKDLSLSQNVTATVYTNGDTESNFLLNKSSDTELGAKGTLVEAYKIDEDTVNISVINYYLAQADEDYNEKDEDVDITVVSGVVALNSGERTLELEDHANIATIREDDYLVITVADGVIETVEPATVVENESVSRYRASDYVTAGEKYEYNKVAALDDTNSLGYALMTGSGSSGYKLNDDGYNFYLDPNGYVLGVEGYDAGVNLEDYLFVKQVGTNGFDKIAKVLFTDGSTKTVTVDKVGGNDVSDSNFPAGSSSSAANKFYTFKTDSDGNYELTVVASSGTKKVTQSSVGSATIDNVAQPIRNGSSAAVAKSGNANTLFIANDKTYTGVKNAPEVKTASTVYYVLDENDRLLIVYTAEKGSTSANADDIIYILDKAPSNSKVGDNDAHTYEVIMKGDKTTLDAKVYNPVKGLGVYAIDSYEDDLAVLGTAIADDGMANDMIHYLGRITSADYSDPTLTLGSHGYLAADDCKVFTIDGTDVSEVGARGVKKAVEDGFRFATAIEVSSSDDNIGTVYLSKKATTGASADSSITVPADADASDVMDALRDVAANGSVTVPTGVQIAEKITVPTDKKLVVEGTAKLTNVELGATSKLDVKGTAEVTVASVPAAAEVDMENGTKLTVSGSVAGTIDATTTGADTSTTVIVNGNIAAGAEITADPKTHFEVTGAFNAPIQVKVTETNVSSNNTSSTSNIRAAGGFRLVQFTEDSWGAGKVVADSYANNAWKPFFIHWGPRDATNANGVNTHGVMVTIKDGNDVKFQMVSKLGIATINTNPLNTDAYYYSAGGALTAGQTYSFTVSVLTTATENGNGNTALDVSGLTTLMSGSFEA